MGAKRSEEWIHSEASLVDSFVTALQSGGTCWRQVEVATEWDHRAGYADILVRTAKGHLIVFEAKLANWRRAFQQAYRSTAYANRVYVLMPRSGVHRALKQREEFESRGIGLCSFHHGRVKVHIRALDQVEMLSWIRRRAHAHFDETSRDAGAIPQGRSQLL